MTPIQRPEPSVRSVTCTQRIPLRVLLFAILLIIPVRAYAQAGTVLGRIVDAASGQPVPAALVTLEPGTTGLILDRAASALVTTRSVVTTDDGAYRFTDVAPGRYRLRISRLGYRSVFVDVDVRRPTAAAVSVGLELQPVALEPFNVEQRASALFYRGTSGPSELDEARVNTERLRQAMFLAPDARMLTYADVMDGVTLGEGDVFRALQRFPGVGTRDDYSAELWTRGAPWTHTRVTFDGIPLFNPVHAVGVLSAITPEVLGSAFFHPGMRPSSLSDGAAGAVDLRSRAGGGDGGVRALADLSMASSKLVLDQRKERAAWLLAARRSHVGVLSDGLGSLGLDTLDLPYVFHDIAGRADLELGRRTHVEASGLWEQDRLEGDVEGVLERTQARWGNTAGRVTLLNFIGKLELSHTLGVSRFAARVDERLVRTRDTAPSWTEPASDNEIRYTQLSGQLNPNAPVTDGFPVPVGSPRPPAWLLGYDVSWQGGDYDGPMPRYYAVKPDTIARIRYHRELRVLGVWADTRIYLGNHITINPAVRIEGGTEFDSAPAVRAAPRVAARLALTPDYTISVAVGRSWQYLQAIALAGPSIHPAFHASHFWIWPDAATPAIRADVATLGSELWLGNGWLASANAFARRARDMAVPDPTTGKLGRRPLYVRGENNAHGLELGLRRIGASWSTSLGYTYGESTIDVDTLTFPSSADRRHTFDAMLGVRVIPALRLAAAFTSMSGAPFTRAYAITREDCTNFGFGCSNADGSYVEAPNAERTPAYRSLDASAQWSHAIGRSEIAVYLQVRNVLGRDNASTYSGSRVTRRLQTRSGQTAFEFEDRFEDGLPRLPLVGLRVTF